MTSTTMRKKFIQISAVAKVVAKEALAQPINKCLALHPGFEFAPPKNAFPFVFSEKDYDASSSVIYNLYVYYPGPRPLPFKGHIWNFGQ